MTQILDRPGILVFDEKKLERNEAIHDAYKKGTSIKELSKRYALHERYIRSVINHYEAWGMFA